MGVLVTAEGHNLFVYHGLEHEEEQEIVTAVLSAEAEAEVKKGAGKQRAKQAGHGGAKNGRGEEKPSIHHSIHRQGVSSRSGAGSSFGSHSAASEGTSSRVLEATQPAT